MQNSRKIIGMFMTYTKDTMRNKDGKKSGTENI